MSDRILNSNLLIVHAAFPRIGKALELFWGNKEFRPYMDNLLSGTRNSRQGFPSDVLFALIAIQQLHDAEFPELITGETDAWKLSHPDII